MIAHEIVSWLPYKVGIIIMYHHVVVAVVVVAVAVAVDFAAAFVVVVKTEALKQNFGRGHQQNL